MDPAALPDAADSAVLVVRLWMEDGREPHLRIRAIAAFDGLGGPVTTVVADGRRDAVAALGALLTEFERRWQAGHSAD